MRGLPVFGDPSWPMAAGVRISPAAQARLLEIAAHSGQPALLRLAVDGGGCSGFQYSFDLDALHPGDAAVYFGANQEAGLLVDPLSAPLLQGAVLGYEDSLAGQRFTVENPNAVAGCGCGVSFAV